MWNLWILWYLFHIIKTCERFKIDRICLWNAQYKFTTKWVFSSFIHINDSKVQFCVGIILQYTVEYANLYSGIELIVIFNENCVFNDIQWIISIMYEFRTMNDYEQHCLHICVWATACDSIKFRAALIRLNALHVS